MAVIIEYKQRNLIRIIDPAEEAIAKRLRAKRSIQITKISQASHYQKRIKAHVNSHIERVVYTTDGANKGSKAAWRRLFGAPRFDCPHPCWKSFGKRRGQWKKEGWPGARTLNEAGRCIYPEIG